MHSTIRGYRPFMHMPDEVLSILAEGRQAYVAIETKNGPHVTPELYTWSDGALWVAAAATTLKARQLADGPARAAVVVTASGRDVILYGSVDSFDVARPLDLIRRRTKIPKAVVAGARLATRNASDLLALATDIVMGKLGVRVPPRRVLFGLRPEAVAVAEGDVVIWMQDWGGTRSDEEHGIGAPTPAGGQPAVAGLPGPMALPCRWFADDQRIFIPPSLFALVETGPRFPIAVVVDQYTAPGPAAKWGFLRRGEGVLTGDPGHVDFRVKETVEWNGVATSRVT